MATQAQDGNSNIVEANNSPSREQQQLSNSPEKCTVSEQHNNRINSESSPNKIPQSNKNSPQKIAVVDVPEKEQHSTDCDNSRGNWAERAIRGQCGLSNSWLLYMTGLLLILLLTWAILYSLLKVEVAPGGDLFKLIVLILVAYVAGGLVGRCKLPPLLGMLIAGIALRTVGFFQVTGVYLEIIIKLREIALTVILIKAGLGLDGPSLLKLSLVVLRLAFLPCIGEAVAAAVVSHYVLDYPWLWGLLMGFMLSAVSPAVVVPVLLSLQERHYGESKGIATLVIAASSLDDIVAISIFGVFLGMIFSTGDLTQQLMQGPIEMVIGLTFGIAWGLIASFVPHREDKHVTAKRVIMVGFGGLCAVLGSEIIHYSGAGPLACIVAAFVACLSWKIQGWSTTYNPVADAFSVIWQILQPMLFGLIGAEIDLTILELETVGKGLLVIIGALVFRVFVCCLVLLGGKLNWKEILFVNLAWLPKATVQAALGPEAMDQVRQQALDRGQNPDEHPDMIKASQLLTIAVISILLTAPIGSIGISITGPKLLSNELPKGKENAIAVNETSMHMSEGTEPTGNGKETTAGTSV